MGATDRRTDATDAHAPGIVRVADNHALQTAVRQLIADAQLDDPLRRVTLITDAPAQAWALRRQIAAGAPAGAGLANLRVLTISEVLEMPPDSTTSALRMAVIDAMLRRETGPLAVSSQHPQTAMRLADLESTLRWCVLDAQVDERLAAAGVSPTARVAIDAARRARDLLAARPSTRSQPRDLQNEDLGVVIVVAQRVPSAATTMLNRNAGASGSPITRIVLEPERSMVPSEVLSCPDPDTEVAIAVRTVGELIAGGTDPARICIAYSVGQPYAPLLESALAAAGITWQGPTGSTLRSTTVARQCLALLDMAAQRTDDASGMTRLRLLRWLSLGQVLVDGASLPTGSLIALIRDEGLHREARDWSRTLDTIAAADDQGERGEQGERDDDDNPRLSRHQRAAQAARQLRHLIKRLDADLAGLVSAPDWTTLGTRLMRQLDDLHLAGGWWRADPAERDAHAALTALLTDVLPALDRDSLGAPDSADLGRMIERQLGQRRSRHGLSTTGIHVGPVASTRGLEFDSVIVVGAADGLLPAMRTPDPLLPDTARVILRADGDDLPTATDEEWSTRRDLMCLLGSAGHRLATYARGAMPGRGVASTSRYLSAAPLHQIASSISALRDGPGPMSDGDLAVRIALAMTQPDVDRAAQVASLLAWAAPAASRHFGTLGAVDGLEGLERWTLRDQTISASAIESWLHCPYHFFVRRILGISTDEVSDHDVDVIEPKDFGTLLHSALEELVITALDGGWAPTPGDAWPEQTLTMLIAILDRHVAEAHERGITGWRPSWDRVHSLVLDSLPDLLAKDTADVRNDPGLAPLRAEQQFGFDGTPEVSFPLAGGGSVRFRGAIDRLDVSADGSTVGVVDYKSGSATSFTKGLGTPTRSGSATPREKVQDLVYDIAARILVPSARDVRVSFVFVPNQGRGVKIIQPDHDDDRRATLAAIIDDLDAAGQSLTFPPQPGGPSDFCPVCRRLGHVARRVAARSEDT